MTPPEQQALFLINTYGKERAADHCSFVLSKEFGLERPELRVWWKMVYCLIMDQK
jgi:hypothetical protein